MNKLIACLILLTLSFSTKADCFDDAAARHRVNPWVLKAIAFGESSFRPNVISKNTNNTIDVGATGTNSVHFPELRKYGIEPEDLLDPCKSIYVAAWLYRKKVEKYGNTWDAVGAYHSENSPNKERYIAKIQSILRQWSQVGQF